MKRYNNLDGLRALASISIICMHVKMNLGYELGIPAGVEHVIDSAAWFVCLFFVLSGFSMCCGYYEKFKENKININEFYKRRYGKILPFFTLLVLVDLIAGLVFDGGIKIGSIYEAFADITLMFGLFPAANISVIGVGWTLGVIFGFYLLFPFFVFLIWNKKRAWFSLLALLAVNFICDTYFLADGRPVEASTVRWLCYFVVGSLIYLYRNEIRNRYEKLGRTKGNIIGFGLVAVGLIITQVICIANNDVGMINTIKYMLGYSLVVIGAIGSEVTFWSNCVSRFISKISLEIYLAHMMIFRIVEKLGITRIWGEENRTYLISCIVTLLGVICFAAVYQWGEKHVLLRIRTGQNGKCKKGQGNSLDTL